MALILTASLYMVSRSIITKGHSKLACRIVSFTLIFLRRQQVLQCMCNGPFFLHRPLLLVIMLFWLEWLLFISSVILEDIHL